MRNAADGVGAGSPFGCEKVNSARISPGVPLGMCWLMIAPSAAHLGAERHATARDQRLASSARQSAFSITARCEYAWGWLPSERRLRGPYCSLSMPVGPARPV